MTATPPAATTVLAVEERRGNRTWWWIAAALAIAVTAVVVAFGRDSGDGADGPLGATATTVVVPTVTDAPPPPVTSGTTVTPTEPSVELVAADIDELIVLVRDRPSAFGDQADELGDDLERIAARRGSGSNRPRIDRLLGQVDGWAVDATMPAEAADLVRTVLADLAAESGNDGDDGDDD